MFKKAGTEHQQDINADAKKKREREMQVARATEETEVL